MREFADAAFSYPGLDYRRYVKPDPKLYRTDGRRYEIRWVPGAPSGENYAIIRKLTAHAA